MLIGEEIKTKITPGNVDRPSALHTAQTIKQLIRVNIIASSREYTVSLFIQELYLKNHIEFHLVPPTRFELVPFTGIEPAPSAN